ncbi:hypothetical protein [Nocardioides sp. B-3]|uniref:hypothetical protein n=1 Tax=Nocardioides sp. B-3 TaxID=2895565 RepID=UPI00215298CD|nr:hypothetical protein [Nocardioides sp. B-3]UUZ58672.1 hypothetical protein LP418_21525 [Nocardioides sp. B-3]
MLVPASPTAERDLRIMRRAAEAWEGGIDYLSDEMGLDWLRDGVDFHITPDVVGLTEGDEVSTFPLYDPEIVIVATNPVGGIGIGGGPGLPHRRAGHLRRERRALPQHREPVLHGDSGGHARLRRPPR